MTTTLDARGLACPRPVLLTRNAMKQADRIVTLVDNETSLTNVSRMAARAGWHVNVVEGDDEFRIELAKGEAVTQVGSLASGSDEAVNAPLVLVVSSDTMGRGEAELGNILVRGFFHTLGEIHPLPQTIVFLNSGVKLVCQGSPLLDDLCTLEAKGIDMLVCGTCLGYFELTQRLVVGQVSKMYNIAETMLGAGKVVNL